MNASLVCPICGVPQAAGAAACANCGFALSPSAGATAAPATGLAAPLTLLGALPVGRHPVSLAVNSANGVLYVASAWDNVIDALDLRAGRSLGVIKVGRKPVAVCVHERANRVYAVIELDASVTVIDGAKGTILHVTKNPFTYSAIAINQETSYVYAIDQVIDSVCFLNDQGRHGSSERVGKGPFALARHGDAKLLYCTNATENTVSCIELSKRKVVATIPVGQQPMGLAVNEATGFVYVANTNDDSLSIIDAQHAVRATVPAGHAPIAVATHPTTGHVYVANRDDNALTVLDASGQPRGSVPTGQTPVAVVVDPVSGYVAVANEADNTVSVFRPG